MKKLLFVLIAVISLFSTNVFAYSDQHFQPKCLYDASTNTAKWDTNMQTIMFQGNTASRFEYNNNNSITAITFPGAVQVQLIGVFDKAYLYKVDSNENLFNSNTDKTNTVMLTEGEYSLSFMLDYGSYSTGAGIRIKVGSGSYTTPDIVNKPANVTPAAIDTNRGSYFTSMPSLPANANISSWATAEVNEAFTKSIIPLNIYNEGNYKRTITRKEFAYIMVGAMQSLNYTFDELMSTYNKYGFKTRFNDTNNDLIIETACRYNIVSGTSDITFSPDDLLTREQTAAMLNRLYNQCQTQYGVGKPIINSPTYFADRSNFSSWAIESINFISSINDPIINRPVMAGVGNDMFQPKGNITVEQALAATKRFLSYAKGKHDTIQNYINNHS